MIICSNCGSGNKDEARFCQRCGSPLSQELHDPSLHSKSKRKNRSSRSVAAGIIALMAVACIGGFFMIKSYMKESEQAREMDSVYTQITDLCTHMEEDYLEEAITEEAKTDIDNVRKSAEDTKNSDNISDASKIDALRSILSNLKETDQELVDAQTSSLNESWEPVKENEDNLAEFLLPGEANEMSAIESSFTEHMDAHKFKDASKDIEDYVDFQKKVMDTSDNSVQQKEHLLKDTEYMPKTLTVEADASAYSDLSANHFTLFEQIGNKKGHFLPVKIEEAEGKNDQVKYKLTFQPENSRNYSSQRGYVLHVRSQTGDKGFELKDGTLPQAKVQKAVTGKLKDFVTAFNNDCKGKAYNELADLVESGSDAEQNLRDIVADSQYGKAIVDKQDQFSHFEIKDDDTVSCIVRFTYHIGKERSYSGVKEREAEKKVMRASNEIQEYDGTEYVIGKNSKGELVANKLSDATFGVEEYLEENDCFTFHMDNHRVNLLYQYRFDDLEITKVERCQYIPKDNAINLEKLLYDD